MQREACRIEMLGNLRACQQDRDPVVFSRQQTGTLLAYLALHLHRSHTRDELMAQVWPEDAPETARHKLRQSLYALRRQLQSHSSDEADIFFTTRDTIQLDPALFTTDVLQFDQALQSATHATDSSERIRLLSKAVRLYHGELLPGFYVEAFEAERNRLAECHRGALQMLMRAYEQTGDLKRAIETGRRALALDPLMEEAHCDLMRLYAADGQPSAVLRQYQELASILKKEWDEAPSRTTSDLMESLRQTAQAKAASQETVPVAAAVPSVSVERPGGVAADPSPDLTPTVPVPLPAAPPQSSPQGRSRYQPALALLGTALCLLVAWQAVGWRNGRFTDTVPNHDARPAQPNVRQPALDGVPRDPDPHPHKDLVLTPTRPLLSDSGGARSVRPPVPARGTSTIASSSAKRSKVPHSANGSSQPLLARSEPKVAPPPLASAPNDPLPPKALQAPPAQNRVPPGKRLWTVHFKPETGDKGSEAVAVTTGPKGEVYVTGFVDTIDHDVVFLTLKYDNVGNLLWQKRYNGPGNDLDRATAIAVDDQGNVYVTGESDNNKGNGATRLAGLDIATIKYDANGNQKWVQRYNGPDDGEDRPLRLLVDENGVYVLGKSWSRGKTGQAGFNYVLVTYDPNGVKQWDYRYDGGQGDDEPVDMVRDRDGNLYVTGQSRAAPATGPEFDMLTLKISPEGKKLWERRYGVNNQADDCPCGIGVDGGGYVYVIGTGRGLPGTPDAVRVGCLTIKYDANGNRLWVRGTTQERDRIETATMAKVIGDGEVVAYGMARDDNGYPTCRVVERDVNGMPRWTADIANLAGEDGLCALAADSSGICLCGGLRRPGAGDAVGFCTFRYDYNGKLTWQAFLDAPTVWSHARCIAVYDDNIIVVGQTVDGNAHHMVMACYQR